MSDESKLIGKKINPKWFDKQWKAHATEVVRNNQKLTGEYLLDYCDLSLLSDFNLDRYFQIVGAKRLVYADLSGLRVQADTISESVMQGCNFSGVVFHRSAGGTITISGCDFRFAKGIWGGQKPVWGNGLSDYRDKPPLVRHSVVSWPVADVPAWSSIRSLGNLPIFGVSNFVLFFLLAYAGFGKWYNTQIAKIQESIASSGDDIPAVFSKLELAPNPWPFGMLFISILALSIASGLFATRCPDPVKDYSPVQWEVGQNEMLEYRSANYDRPVSRWVCFLLYVLGGSIAIPYAAHRAFDAILFFFS